MLKKLQEIRTEKSEKSEKGFTIIEVMIVLAIAGLIMLIVFLAVPALQRNSRNTQRGSDVGRLLAAVAEHQANNNGALPASGQFSTVFPNTTPNLGYYTTAANVQWNYTATARGTAPTPPAGLDSVTVFNYAKCLNATTATLTNASARGYVAMYNIETSGATATHCQEG